MFTQVFVTVCKAKTNKTIHSNYRARCHLIVDTTDPELSRIVCFSSGHLKFQRSPEQNKQFRIRARQFKKNKERGAAFVNGKCFVFFSKADTLCFVRAVPVPFQPAALRFSFSATAPWRAHKAFHLSTHHNSMLDRSLSLWIEDRWIKTFILIKHINGLQCTCNTQYNNPPTLPHPHPPNAQRSEADFGR